MAYSEQTVFHMQTYDVGQLNLIFCLIIITHSMRSGCALIVCSAPWTVLLIPLAKKAVLTIIFSLVWM